jgi:hypothetical protein
MKIHFTTHARKLCSISCPSCHDTKCWRHGSYTRKWFHFCDPLKCITRKVQRYYCTSKTCTRRTFTVQAPDVLHYCRFFVQDLYDIDQLSVSLPSIYAIANILHLSRGVVQRVQSLIERSKTFLRGLCREIIAGEESQRLGQYMKTVQTRYCWITFRALWYRHIYRFKT